jgi:uncharacterized protein YndB with AHSA1/START domain
VLVILSVLVAIVVVVAVIGYLLPAEHTATASRTYDVPPPVVWRMITDVASMPRWRPKLEAVEMLSGRGEPLAWREKWERGDEIPFRETERVEQRRVVVVIDSDDLPFGGSWTYQLEPTGDGGTVLTITEDGAVYNPFFRVASRFFFDPTNTMKVYLTDLAAGLHDDGAGESGAGGLERLAAWMTGSFSSAAQALRDDEYRDIRLEMSPIWVDRDDGHWLYVEQAAAGRLERPYRQRVYRVHEPEPGVFASDVYTMTSPLRFAGGWRSPQRFNGLTPDSLSLRSGCTVWLEWTGEAFVGGTRGTGCESDLRGALYATSEVTVTNEGITSWDRGFNADGNQRWGAESGPYVFRRRP